MLLNEKEKKQQMISLDITIFSHFLDIIKISFEINLCFLSYRKSHKIYNNFQK